VHYYFQKGMWLNFASLIAIFGPVEVVGMNLFGINNIEKFFQFPAESNVTIGHQEM